MARKKLWLGMLAMSLVFGLMVGCGDSTEEEKIDNTISSVSIQVGYGSDAPKVGTTLYANVKNKTGSSVSGVTYQWKRSDSQNSGFVNIDGAISNSYTLVSQDSGKYINVEAKNSNTAAPVPSNAVGPVDANRADKPTADPTGGNVVPGQEITLASTTENATIFYTLDGTTPTRSSTQYSSYPKLTITSSCTLKAIAAKTGMVDSEVLSVSYTVAAAPSFSPVTSSASIFSNGINSVAYGNNRFVAGGNTSIAYSTNGTSWTASTNVSTAIFQGITYGAQFIAVGYGSGGVINYSSDGSSWNNVTETTFGTSYINDVAYGGGKYVAVGRDGKMAYSANGTSWTAVTTTQFGASDYINGITYADGKFVAVGDGGKMAYSTDGAAWTAVTDSKFDTSTIKGITYGGPSGKEKFIAVGSSLGSFKIAYSTDGITWTSVSQYLSGGLFSSLNRVVWGGNKFVAVAGEGVMYFSLDGTYWAKIDGGTGAGKTQFDTNSSSAIKDITYGGEKFLAVGSKYVSLTSSTGEMAISDVTSIPTPEQVAKPTATPAGGNYNTAQTVTLASATQGADIYYTLDGTNPSTGSTKYISSITISTTTTLKVIAVKTGMTNSEILTAEYTITLQNDPGSEANPIPLTVNTWKDGEITSSASGAAVWYSFTVTSGQTYYVWWNDSYEGNGTKTMDIMVDASYASSGSSIFSEADSGWTAPKQFTATSSGIVKLKVTRHYLSTVGTFAIAYSTSNSRPGSGSGSQGSEANPIPLTANTWEDGEITSIGMDGGVWYSFNVTSGTTYYVWWNDSYQGNGTKTSNIYVTASYASSGSSIFYQTNSGWETPSQFTATSSGTVKVWAGANGTGTFAILYTTSNTRPGQGSSAADPIPLTSGTWKDGELTSSASGAAVYYSFNVTSGTTYYVWMNAKSGTFSTSGDGTKTLETKVDAYYTSGGSNIVTGDYAWWNSPKSFTANQTGTVVLKVMPYYSGNTGTFALAYRTTNSRP